MPYSAPPADPAVVRAAAREAVQGMDLVVKQAGKIPELDLPDRLAAGHVVPGDGAGNVPEDRLPARLAPGQMALNFAALDGGGKVPLQQLPAAVMTYEGVWDAAANTPALADGVGDPGQVYRVTVAGTRNLGSGAQTFAVGDYVICNATKVWEKSDTTDAVASVNGKTGVVSLAAGDVGAVPASSVTGWQAYAPALTAAITNPTGYTAAGRWARQLDGTVIARGSFLFNAGMTPGNGNYSISLPVAPAANTDGITPLGTALLFNSGTSAFVQAALIRGAGSTAEMRTNGGIPGESNPWPWVAGYRIGFMAVYEPAP